MKKTDTFFIGLMLFSMFFGAGNLIFPSFLGAEAGTNFWLAMAGFILTGVGLPVAVILAVSLVKGGVNTIAGRVHPKFSTIFMVIIYLSIGPFLAIPRNASVAFQMAAAPFLDGHGSHTIPLLVFTFMFFAVVYLVALNPSKIETYMGRWITPVLLLSIGALCVLVFFNLHHPVQAPSKAYESGSFFTGFIEGYSTMDALGALAFGIVIISAVRHRGAGDSKQLTRNSFKAGLIAGLFLSVIYVSLGLMGRNMAGEGSFRDGAEILSTASTILMGTSGKALLGLIFTLACFTTVVGLTSACGQYFSGLIPKASYKGIVFAVTMVGFILSNLGLAQILKVSVPFLVSAYPITIVLITLAFFHRFIGERKKVYGTAILFTGIFAVIGGLNSIGLTLGPLQSMMNLLPLSSAGMAWVVPAIIGTGVGLILSKFDKTPVLSGERKAIKKAG
ncbi:branched-chain amino acid transport system II carrier protein [Falsibacillus albus]|uniref:Branched-chain amino acid transport system carrier protein n=1 Tax=Falsibacillus albus TaxID=2478915 RepID=A0A3L7JSL6_9BACI|nr:branched-chain amino acid transport system II carrier protein [Falsibacillus albus]RLQ93823.1 branched-chain amino acid transport system II carrier protein [Falsibacillus albus]